MFSGSASEVTRPLESVYTPCHVPRGASLNQFVETFQLGPLVLVYSSIKASRSPLLSITVTVTVADALPERAVIVAVPFEAAKTSPWLLTVATFSSLLDQLTTASSTA